MSEWVNDWHIAWLTAAAAAAAAAEGKKVALHIFRYIFILRVFQMQMYSARKDLRFVFHLLEHLKEQLWVHEWVNEKVREWLTEWICVRKLTWHFAGGIWLGIGDRGSEEWEFRNRGLGPPETNDVTFHWNIKPTMRMLGNYVCFIDYIIIIADDTPAPKK